jgi:Esterase-like activity of phytase
VNNRIFTYDLVTGESHEYVYSVDAINQGKGVNELVAINGHELLVLERDNRSKVPTPPNTAQTPNLKRVYRIDLAQPGLTDVSAVESLPETAAELAALSIVPVTKTLFLDLLSPDYVVGGGLTIKDVIAEKVEALTWGPSLPDGRVLFYVMTDNDLFTGLPTQIYAFAVDAAAAGFQYQAQELPGPMFPPGQVKKILGQ